MMTSDLHLGKMIPLCVKIFTHKSNLDKKEKQENYVFIDSSWQQPLPKAPLINFKAFPWNLHHFPKSSLKMGKTKNWRRNFTKVSATYSQSFFCSPFVFVHMSNRRRRGECHDIRKTHRKNKWTTCKYKINHPSIVVVIRWSIYFEIWGRQLQSRHATRFSLSLAQLLFHLPSFCSIQNVGCIILKCHLKNMLYDKNVLFWLRWIDIWSFRTSE